MKNIIGTIMHGIGCNLSALAMRLDPSEGREHIPVNKFCQRLFSLGGFLEARGDELRGGYHV